MARNPIVFSNGTLVSNAKVNVGGTIYDVEPAQYEGSTPLSASNMNQLQTNLYDYVDSKVIDEYSESTTDGYSANYVNGLNTYSTTETRVGTWIDGKPIYRKVIDCGGLTNATTKNVNHGISNMDTVTNFILIAKNPTANNWIPIPYTNKSNATYQVDVYISNTQFVISCGDNKTAYTLSKAVIEYTKTTD